MTSPLYRTPRALESAIKAKAKAEAAALGVGIADLIRQLYFQRLLARVFIHDSDGWMLKGGQALLVRYPAKARNSGDVDLYHPTANSVQEAIEAISEAAATDLGDYFSFTVVKSELNSNTLDGAKLTFQVSLGTQKVGFVSVDLATSRLVTGTPASLKMRPAIPIDWPDDWPHVTIYPIVDHIADKICAIFEWHNGRPSSRYRDLADLLFIAQNEIINGRAVSTALSSEKERRLRRGTDLRLPEQFLIPDPATWRIGYPKQAKLVLGLQGCATLEEAERSARFFVNPILKTTDLTWQPRTWTWGTQE